MIGIKTAFDEINLENKPRRWIAAAFATCGQDRIIGQPS
jgi:hypothetical protein